MPRERSPNRDRALQIWLERKGEVSNRELAEMLDEKEKTISNWKSRDNWIVVLQTGERSTTNKSESKKDAKEVSVDGELTPKQRLFVQEYLVDLNASAAYRRAGYTSKNPDVDAHRLLVNPSIDELIQAAMREREKRIELSQDKVVQQLAKIAFADIKDVVTWERGQISIRPSSEVDGTILAEISESVNEFGSTKKIKLNDRMKALLKLYDHMSDEQRLKVDKMRAEIAKLQGGNGKDDDGINITVDYGDGNE